MNISKKDIISPNILKKIQTGQEVNEETVSALWDWIASNLDKYEEIENFNECLRLLERMDGMWMYQACCGLSAPQNFLLGGVWGSLRVLKSFFQKKREQQNCHLLGKKYGEDTSFLFLNAIYTHPGIKNQTLAQLCSVSPARISQMASTAASDGLITSQRIGREKYYYLKTMGTNVYEAAKQERKSKHTRCSKVTEKTIYKYILFDNQMDDSTERLRDFIERANWNPDRYGIQIAIAFQEKPYAGFEQRKDDYICKDEKMDLTDVCNNFCKLPKEINSIKQPLYTK